MTIATAAATTATAGSRFVLPSPGIRRRTCEGWQLWCTTRGVFIPAPVLTREEYLLLSPRPLTMYNLHRTATHVNMRFQDTPMSGKVAELLTARLMNKALKINPHTKPGIMVNGGGYQGKTATVCENAAAFEDAWRALHGELGPNPVSGARDLNAPVVYVKTPVTAKPISTCEAILDFFGAPHKGMTLPQLLRAVDDSLVEHQTKVLIMDDITRLKMHREADQDVLDMIRDLMDMDVTLVLIGVGIPRSGLLREGRYDERAGQIVYDSCSRRRAPKSYNDEASTQTERRFDLVDLGAFNYDTPAGIAAWTSHLAGIGAQLRLFETEPETLSSGDMPEYLFRRTGGVVGLLERLIEDGCAKVLGKPEEKLTIPILEEIEINLGNEPDRDPGAGEVPVIPARRPVARKRKNSSFDDLGSAGR